MSSKLSEPRSIATQLVLLFTLSGALLLCCGLGVLYWIFVQHAYEEDNEVLADKVIALRADVFKLNDATALGDDLKQLHTGEHVAYWIRVLDSAGATLAETPEMNRLLPTTVFPRQTSITEPAGPENFRVGGKLFSLISAPVIFSGQPHVMQVAQDRSGDANFVKEFGILLVVVLVLGSLASAGIAIKVTKRGLRPLEEMAGSLKEFGPERLHERIPPRGWPRELRPLAVAFDEMFDRLEESFTRLSQFSADLAHELRTPIANIRGEGEVALTRSRAPEEYREVIESSIAECERLSRIVDSLLFLARAEAAEEQIERTTFDGREAIEKIAAFFEPLAEERETTITCTGEAEIHADRLLVGRAVSNLVENALRFTPAGGTIQIVLQTNGREARVQVRDSGTGIPAEHLPRVFDRFYRVDKSRSLQGSGLGLALVKSIMDLHGGSAVVESKVDQGTTFTLTFPNG
jgi:two-component system heavy metal sensor histidine kinase CusS